jgi:hypothetical protein
MFGIALKRIMLLLNQTKYIKILESVADLCEELETHLATKKDKKLISRNEEILRKSLGNLQEKFSIVADEQSDE